MVCAPILLGIWYAAGVAARAAVFSEIPDVLRFCAFIMGGVCVAVSVVGAAALVVFVCVSLWDRFDLGRSFFRFYDWVISDD